MEVTVVEINSPSREQAVTALRARSAELIRQGDMTGAERVQRDLVTLSKAPGENLYDMHRLATQRLKHTRWPSEESLGEFIGWNPQFVLPGALVLVGGAVAMGVGAFGGGGPVALGVGASLVGGVLGGTLWLKHRIDSRTRAANVLEAVERRQELVRTFTPAAEPVGVQIDRRVFLAALQGQEARLAEGGAYERAGEMRKVHEALSKLPGANVEELFQNLLASGDREALGYVQGSCSQEIARSIETLAEVSKLVGPNGQTLLREEADSLVIGGVVLKKREAAAA